MRKVRTALFSYLDPTSPSQNLASRSERAAQSRKTASPSPLFTEVGLSLEREDAKLSHSREFWIIKKNWTVVLLNSSCICSL